MDVDTTLGHYKIVSRIGAGGMGEVYKAHDSRLDREVAIKVLPSELSSDEDRLRRFEQEAKATSALNHPNILTVYDIGEHDGSPFIVAELLEGEELRERLDEGPIPLRKVTEYAQQIVSGLSAADEKGITHRDLKPENLFITKDERVKILDFGLAKLREPDTNIHGSEDATRRAITNPGVIMGTVGYMSPEQVRGQAVDYRSDIFSFGTILYEMIIGRRAFQEETMAETMTAIMKQEPEELTVSKPDISPALERIVRRCLEKKPERRFQSTSDLGFAIGSLSATTSSSRTSLPEIAVEPKAEKRSGRLWLLGLMAVLLVALGAGLGVWAPWRSKSSAQALTFTPFSFEPGGQSRAVWSPDGKGVAFTARQKSTDKLQIYVRYLDSPVATQLTHIPDGVIDRPIQWTAAGRIVFLSRALPKELVSVSPVGGEPEPFYSLPGEFNSQYTDQVVELDVSRDGKAIAAYELGPDGTYSISTGMVGSEMRPYEPAPFAAANYNNHPHLMFSPDGKQLILTLNAGKGEDTWLIPYPANTSTTPRQIFKDMPQRPGTPKFSWMPDNRHIVLSSGDAGGTATKLYIADTVSDRFEIFSAGTSAQRYPSVSPDGRRLIFADMTEDEDIVSLDLSTLAVTPLIATGLIEEMPAWAAREPTLVYETRRNGPSEIWLHKAGQPDRPVVTARDFSSDPSLGFLAPSLSPDATRVIYTPFGHSAAENMLWMSSIGGGSPVRVTSNNSEEEGVAWSPDGNWFAYFTYLPGGKVQLQKVKTTGQAAPVVVVPEMAYSPQLPVWSPTDEWIMYNDNGLKLVSPDGKTTRDLMPKQADAFGFSADGKTVYGFRKNVTGDKAELFSISSSGGSEKVIASFDLDYLPTADLSPSIHLSRSPDGKSMAFSIGKSTSNLWLMDGLDGVPMP